MITDINQISDTEEGQLLIAAIAMLTTAEGYTSKTPLEVLYEVRNTAGLITSVRKMNNGRYSNMTFD